MPSHEKVASPRPHRHRCGRARYYPSYPKPCVGGWDRRSLNVTPAGKMLPCHAAESITGLESGSTRTFARGYLGEFAGLQHLPRQRMDEGAVRKLPTSRADFGGFRSQAFALTGDATATDPVCHSLPTTQESPNLRLSRPTPPMISGACERLLMLLRM
jgi:PqqA peptide cyclase